MNEQYKQVIRSGLRRERINIEMSDLEWAHRQRELAIVDAALNALDEPEWMPLEDGAYQADHDGDSFILFNGFLNVEETDIVTGEKRNAEIALPPEYAICRRTSPAVPTEARTQEVTGED